MLVSLLQRGEFWPSVFVYIIWMWFLNGFCPVYGRSLCQSLRFGRCFARCSPTSPPPTRHITISAVKAGCRRLGLNMELTWVRIFLWKSQLKNYIKLIFFHFNNKCCKQFHFLTLRNFIRICVCFSKKVLKKKHDILKNFTTLLNKKA